MRQMGQSLPNSGRQLLGQLRRLPCHSGRTVLCHLEIARIYAPSPTQKNSPARAGPWRGLTWPLRIRGRRTSGLAVSEVQDRKDREGWRASPQREARNPRGAVAPERADRSPLAGRR